MKREDVEALLARSDQPHGDLFTCAVDPRHLTELCRRWLAVEDAHRTYVNAVYDSDAGEDRGEVLATLPKSLAGFVRIVPEDGQGVA